MGLLRDSAYGFSFDGGTLRRMAMLMNTAPVFERFYMVAMNQSVNMVNRRAQENAPVLTGTLRRAIRGKVLNPYLGQVGVLATVPYARRREYGFDGRTDALGRFYPMDPVDPDKRAHMFYLRRALQTSQPEINALYRTATALAIREIVL